MHKEGLLNANKLAGVDVKILVVFAQLDYGFAIFYKSLFYKCICKIVQVD
jgi:hypothetical protein